jgi:hypothetical protein
MLISQAERRQVEMLFVRGDSIILVSDLGWVYEDFALTLLQVSPTQ